MPFLLYRLQPSPGAVRFDRLHPLKLGGPSGPIARFVGSLQAEAAERGWDLPLQTLTLEGQCLPDSDNVAVLFELSGGQPGAVCLYRLHRVNGVSRDRTTHLSLDFEVLVDEVVGTSMDGFKRSFALPAEPAGKRLREILQLSGGPGGGDWRWEPPAMNLGATLVGPANLATP